MSPAITVKKDLYFARRHGRWQPVRVGHRPVRGHARQLRLPDDEPGPRLPTSCSTTALTTAVVRAALLARASPAAGGRRGRRCRSRDRYLVLPSDGSQIAAIGHARRGESLVIQGPPGHRQVADHHQPHRRLRRARQARAVRLPEARGDRRRPRAACAARARRPRSLIHDSQADKKAFVHAAQGRPTSAGSPKTPTPGRAEAVAGRSLDAAGGRASRRSRRTSRRSRADRQGGASLREVIERLVDCGAPAGATSLPPELRAARPVRGGVVGQRGRWSSRSPPRSPAPVPTPGCPRSPVRLPGPRRARCGPARGRGRRRRAALAAELRSIIATLDDAARWPTPRRRPMPRTCACDRRDDRRARDAAPADRTSRALGGPRRSSPAAEELRVDAQQDTALEAALAKARADAARLAHAPQPRRRARGAGDRDGQGAARSSGSSTAAGAGSRQRSPRCVLERRARRAGDRDGGAPPAGRPVRRRGRRSRRTGPRAEERWGHRDLAALAARIEAVRRPDDPAHRRVARPARRRRRRRSRLGARRHAGGPRATPLGPRRGPRGRRRRAAGRARGHARRPRRAAAGGRHPGVPAHRFARSPPMPRCARALRRLPATPAELEYAVCAATLEEAEAHPPVRRPLRRRPAGRARRPRCRRCSPSSTRPTPRSSSRGSGARFLDRAWRSPQRSVTGMTPAERDAQEALDDAGAGSSSTSSARSCATARSATSPRARPGAVVAALRPIWLMSPSSVSDTLPLDRASFDVVIYDEASQIPVEEAVPGAAPRATGHRRRRPDAAAADAVLHRRLDARRRPRRRRGRAVGIVLDARQLPRASRRAGCRRRCSTWHYRSRYEALIDFSNAAFYEGGWPPSPTGRPAPGAAGDPRSPLDGRGARSEDEGTAGVDGLLARPHQPPSDRTARRTCSARNPAEAAYIAQLVRELLRRETRADASASSRSPRRSRPRSSARWSALADADQDVRARCTRRSRCARTTTSSSGCS